MRCALLFSFLTKVHQSFRPLDAGGDSAARYPYPIRRGVYFGTRDKQACTVPVLPGAGRNPADFARLKTAFPMNQCWRGNGLGVIGPLWP